MDFTSNAEQPVCFRAVFCFSFLRFQRRSCRLFKEDLVVACGILPRSNGTSITAGGPLIFLLIVIGAKKRRRHRQKFYSLNDICFFVCGAGYLQSETWNVPRDSLLKEKFQRCWRDTSGATAEFWPQTTTTNPLFFLKGLRGRNSLFMTISSFFKMVSIAFSFFLKAEWRTAWLTGSDH